MSGVLLVRIENMASGRHCGFYGGLVVSSAVGLWCLCGSAVVLWWCLVVFGLVWFWLHGLFYDFMKKDIDNTLMTHYNGELSKDTKLDMEVSTMIKRCAVCGDKNAVNVRLVWRRDSDGKTVNVCCACAEAGRVNENSIDNYTTKDTIYTERLTMSHYYNGKMVRARRA